MTAAPVLQWIRHAEVLVGDSARGNGLVVKGAGGLGDLRVEVDITKSIRRSPNKALVKIYNLSHENEGRIQGEDDEIQILVGYRDSKVLAFAGNIQHTFGSRATVDHITEIQAADGDSDLRNTIIHAVFRAGTNNTDIINHILAKLGNTKKGHIVVKDQPRLRGRVYSGTVGELLDSIAADSDATWSIQDGKLDIVPVAGVLPNEAVEVRSDTGLLGAPELDNHGVKFKCLMNPHIRPGGTVKLANNDFRIKVQLDHQVSAAVKPSVTHRKKKAPRQLARPDPDGLYKVLHVEHKGDTRGDGDESWITDVQCISLAQLEANKVSSAARAQANAQVLQRLVQGKFATEQQVTAYLGHPANSMSAKERGNLTLIASDMKNHHLNWTQAVLRHPNI